VVAEGLAVTSANPFKGDMDCERLAACIQRYTPDKVAFVRVEAGTNLIGGQPFSLQNLRDVRKVSSSRDSYWLEAIEAACIALLLAPTQGR
jgi:tryptophanase